MGAAVDEWMQFEEVKNDQLIGNLANNWFVNIALTENQHWQFIHSETHIKTREKTESLNGDKQ